MSSRFPFPQLRVTSELLFSGCRPYSSVFVGEEGFPFFFCIVTPALVDLGDHSP